MKNINRRTLINSRNLIFVFLVFCCSCTNHDIIEKNNQWDIIKYKEYFIENNTWNVQAAKNKWSQSVFCDTLTGMMGWKWDFSGENDTKNFNEVKSFPEIIFGKKPYQKYQSTTSILPKKLITAKINLKYEYLTEVQGIYNLTTDITFSDSTNPEEKNIRAKMMIWFDYNNMTFYESKKTDTAIIDGHQYKIYVDTSYIGTEGKWNFIALLPNDLPSKGKINLKKYFDYFLSEGILKPEWYLSSIELGSEISSGKGKITFKEFKVY